MNPSTYRSWWQEMGAISRGMMYLQGNIATPASLDRAERSGYVPAPASPPPRERSAQPLPQDPDGPVSRRRLPWSAKSPQARPRATC